MSSGGAEDDRTGTITHCGRICYNAVRLRKAPVSAETPLGT
jgi:hypothetical protein